MFRHQRTSQNSPASSSFLFAILKSTSCMRTEKLKAASNTSMIKGTALPRPEALFSRTLTLDEVSFYSEVCSNIFTAFIHLVEFGTLKTYRQMYHQEGMGQVRWPTWNSSPEDWQLQQGRKEVIIEASWSSLLILCMPCTAAPSWLLSHATAVT